MFRLNGCRIYYTYSVARLYYVFSGRYCVGGPRGCWWWSLAATSASSSPSSSSSSSKYEGVFGTFGAVYINYRASERPIMGYANGCIGRARQASSRVYAKTNPHGVHDFRRAHENCAHYRWSKEEKHGAHTTQTHIRSTAPRARTRTPS